MGILLHYIALHCIVGPSGSLPTRVSFDHSGTYIASSFVDHAAGMSSIQVMAVKEYANLLPVRIYLSTFVGMVVVVVVVASATAAAALIVIYFVIALIVIC